MSIDTSLNISLPPPDGSGHPYSNLVVNAKTGKTVGSDPDNSANGLNSQLTAVFGDDVDSLAEAQAIADKFNINLQLGGTLRSAKETMQDELDNLDPANPRVPILGKYIDICDKLLAGGSVPGVNFALGLNSDGSNFLSMDADNVGATAAPTTNLSGTVGGNPWLAGNAYVAFLVNFITLAKLMMENMMVEAKCEIASMQMIFEIGNLTAKQIEISGQKMAEMHRIAAITAAVSAATVVATTLISVKGMMKNKMEPEPEADVYTPVKRPAPLPGEKPTPPPDLSKNMQPVRDIDGKPVR